MISSSLRRRTGSFMPLLLAVLALLATPLPGLAQDPPVRDTVPELAAVDTVDGDTLQLRPLVRFPAMPLAPSVGFAGGEWVWDHDALLREAPVSLYDLLVRIPGVAALRTGVLAQPETGSAFGGTVGRVEVLIDGFVLDPLAASSLDLAQIPLVQVREVRVQRRLGLLRILLLTDQPDADQPYTRVEAGIGEPSGNMFRGLFLVPHVMVGPLGLGIERIDTDGSGGTEPANVFSGWAKWAWTRGDRGVQVEWLRTTLRREPNSPWLTDRVRQELIVRARAGIVPGLTAEVYAGRSQLEETLPGSATDTTPEQRLDRESTQLGLRAAYQLPWAILGGTVRYRGAEFMPGTEALLDGDVAWGPLRVAGELGRTGWRDGPATSFGSVHAEAGRVLGAAVFAELTRGDRGAPLYADTAPRATVIGSRDGWRAGVSVDLGTRATGSIALVNLDQDMARPFGLPFDSVAAPTAVGRARGVEAYGRLVLLGDYLAVESWITDWTEAAGWVYMPAREWRTALTLHTLPLPSGNLEILGRVDAGQRSGMLAYDPDGTIEEPFRSMPAYTLINGYLQIRVIDVRAFIRWEDLLGSNPEGLPGRVQRGPRIFYGVKWNLWN
jgi:hypothetical protein